MDFYPPKISERFHAPKNAGKLQGANAVGTNATFVCGAVLRIRMEIECETKEILRAKFQTNGCGYLIAAVDILTEMIKGKKLVDFHGLERQVLQREIENELGAFSEHRQHCLDLCLETLQNALANFRAFQVEEWTGEKALICSCFGVSEETIENLIKTNSLETVEEVTDVCNAGGGCGSCQPLIQELIDVYSNERV
jgi:NifU-like protein